jgi:hypothetical protein
MEEKLNTLEEVHERIMACDNILRRLKYSTLRICMCAKEQGKGRTVRRMLMPAKISFEGENG